MMKRTKSGDEGDDLLFALANTLFVAACMVVLSVWLSYENRECPAPQATI